jgi:hypothetical protein
MDEWEPQAGELVLFEVSRSCEVDPRVPREGRGVIVRDIRRNKAESCDYEVRAEFYGDLCFFRSELAPWTP